MHQKSPLPESRMGICCQFCVGQPRSLQSALAALLLFHHALILPQLLFSQEASLEENDRRQGHSFEPTAPKRVAPADAA
jgi:hypothetical protein